MPYPATTINEWTSIMQQWNKGKEGEPKDWMRVEGMHIWDPQRGRSRMADPEENFEAAPASVLN